MNCQDVQTAAPLYLSGELDAPHLAEVRAHLEACPVCASDMARQAGVDARLREEVLAETPDSKALDLLIKQRIRRSIILRRWLPVAAGIAAMLVLALVGSRLWTESRVARVYVDAARDHHSEVVDKQPRTWLSDQSAVAALAVRQGLSVAPLAEFARAGYNLECGKLCRLDGRVYLHMVYKRNGEDFSVFLRQTGEPFPAALRDSDRGDEHVASFQTGGMAGIVVTDQSTEAARQLAQLAQVASTLL
jgi:anti-sigma factor RsiW